MSDDQTAENGGQSTGNDEPSTQNQDPPTGNEEPRKRNGRPTIVSPDWLSSHLESVTVVDVREARDYVDLGRIPGAVNVPYDRFRDPGSVAAGKLPSPGAFAHLLSAAGIAPDDPLVAYDDETGVYAARFLLTALVYGHRGDLFLLDGGLEAWRSTQEIETGVPPDDREIGSEDRQTTRRDRETPPCDRGVDSSSSPASIPDDSPMIDREAVERAIEDVSEAKGERDDSDGDNDDHDDTDGDNGNDHDDTDGETDDDHDYHDRNGAGNTVIVDTRTPAEYHQAHVPGAVQLGWEKLLEDGRLKPEDEIETLLAERGITPEKRVVLYCNTARRLSHTYVVLSHLGFERVEFYEGSLTDWVRAAAPEWDPIDLQRRVRSFSGNGGFEAMVETLGEDVLNRLKLVGLYHQKQSGYFMLRTRAPGGVLSAEQARVIGEVADEFARAPDAYGGPAQNPIFGDAYLDVTTRQDVQMHWIRIDDVDEIWRRYEAVGLSTLQACGNSVRNVVSCPAAGIGAGETLDPLPVVSRISERFLGDHRYANLPRKFKVSVTGCHENCARAQIQDLAFTPAVKDGRDGYAAHVGGGLSDGPRVASDLECFVSPDQVDELVAALADLFREQGSYLDTAVNRIRYLVEEFGIEQFRDELERYAPFEFAPPDESLTAGYRGDHVGVHEQEDGNRYVGLCVTVGRMGGEEFATLAELSDRYGKGEIRLTPNQNVLVPHVAPEDLEAFLTEPVVQRYSPTPGPFSRGIVTCTGSEFCTYGLIETKNRAIRWARALDDWAIATGFAEEHDVIRIHMSGCSASCAQPQIADIGLRGETYRDDERSGRAADVGLGGDLGRDEFIDWLVGSVPIEDVPSLVERTLLAYEGDRDADESFSDWVRRTPDAELRSVLLDWPSNGAETAEPEVS